MRLFFDFKNRGPFFEIDSLVSFLICSNEVAMEKNTKIHFYSNKAFFMCRLPSIKVGSEIGRDCVISFWYVGVLHVSYCMTREEYVKRSYFTRRKCIFSFRITFHFRF